MTIHPTDPTSRRRRAWASIAVAAVVLLAATTFGTPAPTARADENSLVLPGGGASVTLGANAVLRIDGRLRYVRGCRAGGIDDFAYPASDVYLVPSYWDPIPLITIVNGEPVGPDIPDASGVGTPNTIIQSTSLFVEQLIAVTAPSGTLGAGTYSIVYDTCQDGKFLPSEGDEVFPNAVVVELPPVLPPIDQAIVQLKTSAYSEFGRWQEIGALFDKLINVERIAGNVTCATGDVSACWDLLKMWVDRPEIQAFIASVDQTKAAIECATKVTACFSILAEYAGGNQPSPRDVFFGGAKNLIANQAKSFFGVYADPPRSDYRSPTSVALDFPVPTQRGDGPIVDSLSEAMSALEREQLLWDALLAAIERYQGAQAVGDAPAAAAQAASARSIAAALQDAGADTAGLLAVWIDTVAAELPGFDSINADVRDGLTRTTSFGFTDDEDQALRNAGIAGPARTDLLRATQSSLSSQDAITLTPLADLAAVIDGLNGDQPAISASLDAFISGIDDIAAAISGPGVDAVPTVTTAVRRTAAVGTPVTFTATASPGAAVSWDLDADGTFDDGAGTSATATFVTSGHRVIAVRAEFDGISVTAHALVDITATNAPPTITTSIPAADGGTGSVGVGATFIVTATDPEGDPLAYAWYVDDTLVGSGSTFVFTPTAGDRGGRTVAVAISDGRPGNVARRAWRWHVVDVDADGDGWSANQWADCDDTNGDVHPDRPEVMYNGIDDDCDPGSPDRPLELATSGQLWSWGESPGTGTATSTGVPKFADVDNVDQIAAAFLAGAFLTDDGFVWAWGNGAMAGGGTADLTVNVVTPAPVLPPTGTGQLGGVTQISSASDWFVARLADGHAVTWGGSKFATGRFGQGFTNVEQPYSPRPGYVVDESLAPITGVAAVEGGYGAGYAVMDDGTVRQWGLRICSTAGVVNFWTSVPAPQFGTDVAQIEAGNLSVLVRYDDGTVGWCGDPSRLPDRLALDDFGGMRAVDLATTFNGLSGLILTEDGSLWVIGRPGAVQTNSLVTEAPINATTPVRVVLPDGPQVVSLEGSDTPCSIFARRADGSLWSWGDFNRDCDGQVGTRTIVGGAVAPGRLTIAGDVRDVSGAGWSALAIVTRDGGDVWSWGGAPGAGRGGDLTVPHPIPGLTNVVQVRSLLAHGYALETNGDVVGWGQNEAGQAGLVAGTGPRPVLGIGGTGTMHEIVELADNGATVFALGTDGTVAAWGYDDGRSLGAGTALVSRGTPDYVLGADFQPITDVARVFSGHDGGWAIQDDGTVLQWGTRACTGVAPASAVSDVAVPQPGLPSDVVQIASADGGENALLRRADGSVLSCGDRRVDSASAPLDYDAAPFGSFGPGNPAIDIGATDASFWVLTADGGLWLSTWNSVTAAELGVTEGVLTELTIPYASRVVAIDADSAIHLVLADGSLLTFGPDVAGSVGRPGEDPWTVSPVVIDGHVFQSSASVQNGLALLVPGGVVRRTGWKPPQVDVAVSAVGTSGLEGAIVTAHLVLNRAAATDVTVSWAFDGATGSVSVPAGVTDVPVELQLPGPDGVWGADRALPFELMSVSGGAGLGDEVAEVAVLDNDPRPTASIASVSVSEGNTALTPVVLSVTLSGPAAVPIVVDVRTIDGSAIAPTDYRAADQIVFLPPGATSTTAGLIVYGNGVPQSDRSFAVTATAPAQSQPALATVTIVDDDPVVVIGRPGNAPAGEPVVVHLEAPLLPAGESINIPWATLDGSATSPDNYVGGSGVAVIDSAAGVDVVVATRVRLAANGRLVEAVTDVESLTFLIDLGTATSASRPVIAPSELVGGIRQPIVTSETTTTSTTSTSTTSTSTTSTTTTSTTTTSTTTTTAPPTTSTTAPRTSATTAAPTTAAPTTTTPGAPAVTADAGGVGVTTTTSPTPSGELPATGGGSLRVLLLALVLTILGTAFVRQTPRRVGADRLGSDEGSARCPTQAAIEEPAHRSGHTGP